MPASQADGGATDLPGQIEAVVVSGAVANELGAEGPEVGEPIAPQAFAARLQVQSEPWRKTIQAAGVTPG